MTTELPHLSVDRTSIVETPRLVLRLPAAGDAQAMMDIYQNPDVRRYLLGRPPAGDITVAWHNIARMLGHWHLRGYGDWILVERGSSAIVGRIGVWNPEGGSGLELGWVIRRSRWNEGLATEAAQAALHWIWQHVSEDHVISIIDAENHPSFRVAEKIGERLERVQLVSGTEAKVYGVWRDGRTES